MQQELINYFSSTIKPINEIISKVQHNIEEMKINQFKFDCYITADTRSEEINNLRLNQMTIDDRITNLLSENILPLNEALSMTNL